MLKAKRLKKGSNIAIISPSNGLPSVFPHIYELGLRNLNELLGFNIIEMPTARMSREELYKNPRLRAEDINNAFRDPSIDGIICSIGGYESIRILKYLDKELILKNPKLLMGFSDATTFLTYLNQLGLVTFYGPSIMAGLAQLGSLPAEYHKHLEDFLFSEFDSYSYKPYPVWTNGYRDWTDKSLAGQCTEFYDNSKGWSFLQGKTAVEGDLWGGCMEVLEFLKSTEYYPDKSFFDGKILFFETSEEKPDPLHVGYFLRNYGIQGVFDRIKGLMFARPKDYTKDELQEFKDTITNILQIEFGLPELPVVVDADFGHTDPKLILPLGCRARLDPATNSITLLENPFR